MKRNIVFFIGILWVCLLSPALGKMCQHWGPSTRMGTLDTSAIPEASGLAVSRKFPNRLYHINDSGHGLFFHVTDLEGNHTQSVRVAGMVKRNVDPEDMALGPCSDQWDCLFIGDIGDLDHPPLSASRTTLELFVVKEEEGFPSVVVPMRRVKIEYPDGPHNAEALAVHPNGDIFILTKEFDFFSWRTAPAKIYRLKRSQWEKGDPHVQPLVLIGEINVPRLAGKGAEVWGQMVTAFDIAPDGKSFLVLTYGNAIEFNLDLFDTRLSSSKELIPGKDYQVIRMGALAQQESIAYLPGTRNFLYGTEIGGRFFRLIRGWSIFNRQADLMKVECLD